MHKNAQLHMHAETFLNTLLLFGFVRLWKS